MMMMMIGLNPERIDIGVYIYTQYRYIDRYTVFYY